MKSYLDEYNDTPGVVSMDLVLFRDAVEHREYILLLLLYNYSSSIKLVSLRHVLIWLKDLMRCERVLYSITEATAIDTIF